MKINSIMKSVSQIANRKKNYRVSDYVRKTAKRLGYEVSRKQVMFCLARLQRFGKVFYSRVGQKVKTYTLHEL